MSWPALAKGSTGPEVGNLQRFLNLKGARDLSGSELAIDESFGPRTEASLRKYQFSLGLALASAGVFDILTRRRATDDGFVPFLQAKNCYQRWTKAAPKREIRHIVIHTMESSEKPGTAENVARWFANLLVPKYPAPRASAHYCLDAENTIQCVRHADVAWGAPGRYPDGAYVNDHTLHIEHAGFAAQTAAEWADPLSSLLLWRSARLVKRLAVAYDVPIWRTDALTLKAGERGICGHVDFSKAFGGSHWDPGPHFPFQKYVELIRTAADGLASSNT